MSNTIGNILDYTPEPSPEVHARQTRLLWIVAAISLSMTAIGYFLMANLLF
jgi:hypothetical protein